MSHLHHSLLLYYSWLHNFGGDVYFPMALVSVRLLFSSIRVLKRSLYYHPMSQSNIRGMFYRNTFRSCKNIFSTNLKLVWAPLCSCFRNCHPISIIILILTKQPIRSLLLFFLHPEHFRWQLVVCIKKRGINVFNACSNDVLCEGGD